MKWAFLHIIGGNVKSYPMFPGVYSEGVGKVALITWLKPGRAWGYLSLIQATKLSMKFPNEKPSVLGEKG